jgi:hypothetical protein
MVHNIRRCMVLYCTGIWLNVDSTYMVGIYLSILRGWEKDMHATRTRTAAASSVAWRGRRGRASVTWLGFAIQSSWCELALISSVIVPSLLRLLSSPAGLLPPRYDNKSFGPYLILRDRDIYQTSDITSSAARWFSLSCDSARTEPQESRCLWNPCPPENPARGVRQLGFWGALPRLLSLSSS